LHLAAMLEAAPDATDVGVEVDPDGAALARRTLSERGLADRASVEEVDIRQALAAGRPDALADDIAQALLANSIYDVPVDERPAANPHGRYCDHAQGSFPTHARARSSGDT